MYYIIIGISRYAYSQFRAGNTTDLIFLPNNCWKPAAADY